MFFFYCSILSQIIQVGNEVTEFRRSIADIMIQQNHLDCTKDKVDKVDLNSEDSLFPLIPLKIASKDVTPKELPGRYFMVPSPDPSKTKKDQEKVDKSKSHEEDEEVGGKSKNILQNGFCKSRNGNNNTTSKTSGATEIADNMSDNLSGVSMGTSSLSSDTVSKYAYKIFMCDWNYLENISISQGPKKLKCSECGAEFSINSTSEC